MYPIDFFYRAATLHSNKIAVRDKHNVLTYQELFHVVQHLAYQLQQADPQPGSRVGLCAENSIEYVAAMLAILAAAKVWVPLNAKGTQYELSSIIDTVTPSIVLVDDTTHITLRQLTLPLLEQPAPKLLSIDNTVQQAQAKPPLAPDRMHSKFGLNDTQAIKFTGGTTGAPKGVMQPYRAWNATTINQIIGWGITPQDNFVAVAPLSHGTGTYVIAMLAQGASITVGNSTAPIDVAELFRVFSGTMTFMPPTLIYNLMQSSKVDQEDFHQLRLLIYGGAPMPVERIEQAQQFFGQVVATTYGQTEAPQIATMLPPEYLAQPEYRASVGVPTLFTQIKLISPDGKEITAPNEAGEILISGDLVMTGYWQHPDLSDEVLKDGWLSTGDVGYFSETGFLFIKDRLKDVIISGGFNVYPIDVEGVLALSESVQDAAVLGLADQKWGERVVAAVAPKAGCTINTVELQKLVRSRLGPVMTPKEIFILKELPRSSVGKVLKNKIKEIITQEHSQ